MTIKWKKDESAEARMKDFGLDWKIGDVKVSEVNWNAPNVARAGKVAIDEDSVKDFQIAMLAGDVFPMPILNRSETGLEIISGHHRCAALLAAGMKEFQAYLIRTDDEWTRQALPGCLNRIIGCALTRAEAARWVLSLNLRFNKPLTQLCELYAVDPRAVEKQRLVMQGRERLSALKLEHKNLPDTSVLFLQRLKTDSILGTAARTAIEGRLQGPQIEKMVSEVRDSAQSEASQMGVIAKWQKQFTIDPNGAHEARLKSQQARRRANGPRLKFLQGIALLEQVFFGARNKPTALSQIGITDKNEKEQHEIRCKKLANILSKIH